MRRGIMRDCITRTTMSNNRYQRDSKIGCWMQLMMMHHYCLRVWTSRRTSPTSWRLSVARHFRMCSFLWEIYINLRMQAMLSKLQQYDSWLTRRTSPRHPNENPWAFVSLVNETFPISFLNTCHNYRHRVTLSMWKMAVS